MENRRPLKKILGNSLWQISEKILTMLLSIVISGVIARYLGVEQYGLVNYVISVVSLFTAFSTLGMEKITIQDIVSRKDKEEVILGTSFIIRLIGGIVLIIISQITLYLLNGAVLIYQILGIIMGFCMVFKAFEVIEYYLQAHMNLKIVSVIRFTTAIIVAIAKVLVVLCDWGVIGFVLTYLVDAVTAGMLFYIYYKINRYKKWKFSKGYAKKLLARCWYIAIAGLLSTMYMRIDQVMLGKMLTDTTENGIYSAAVRIAEMWYFIPSAIVASFQPNINARKKANDEEGYINLIQQLYDIVAIIGITFGISITCFGWLAIDILYGTAYLQASRVLMVMAWAGLFATLGTARSIWLINENLQKYTIIYTLTGAITNVVLNYLLIPSLGALGAAITTLISQIVADLLTLMAFKKTRKSSIMILKAIFANKTFANGLKLIINKIRNSKK